MRRRGPSVALEISLLLAGSLLAAPHARAGVPRSCIHPQADALECPRDQRRTLLKVIPSARVRALHAQRRDFERTTTLRDLERNRILWDIRRALRREFRRR